MDRENLLKQLVDRSRPVDDVLTDLRRLGWDSDVTYAVIFPQHVVAVLDALVEGHMSVRAVERWAEALEVREDIEMTEPVREALFMLANPALGYELSADLVQDIRNLLRPSSEQMKH